MVEARQSARVWPQVRLAEAACAESLAVRLHARNRAGVAAEAGAAEVVTTDLHDLTLDAARRMGATRTINVAADPVGLGPWAEDKGRFDVAFECSAAVRAQLSFAAA